jgi:type I restriction enzyme S subunit
MPRRETTTGGREATSGVIPGRYCLSVGHPGLTPPPGFQWVPLTSVARLESGHTPSRKHPEYWDGPIPWIGIRDATHNHGRILQATNEGVTQEGIDNSSARVLPHGTVCLSRTASVGYAVMTGVPMATSQDFVNWVCGDHLNPRYLLYILMLEQDSIRRFAHGTTHQTMYYPEAKALHVCVPDRAYQDEVVRLLGALDDLIEVNLGLARDCEHLAQALASRASSQTPLSAFATWGGLSTVKPVGLVDHYSLPAFDDGRRAERVDGGTVKSNKQRIEQPCVLVARLNPHIPRVWMVYPDESVTSLASTEFVPLTGNEVAQEVVYAVCSAPAFLEQMGGLVTGTTGSHQRVDKDALTSVSVPDVRTLESRVIETITQLVRQAHALRVEIGELAATRDELLPLLMSGRVRVSEAAA